MPGPAKAKGPYTRFACTWSPSGSSLLVIQRPKRSNYGVSGSFTIVKPGRVMLPIVEVPSVALCLRTRLASHPAARYLDWDCRQRIPWANSRPDERSSNQGLPFLEADPLCQMLTDCCSWYMIPSCGFQARKLQRCYLKEQQFGHVAQAKLLPRSNSEECKGGLHACGTMVIFR